MRGSNALTTKRTMADANNLVSVIVPVYNGERYLSAAFDSIFAQYYRPIEVIVVDDGSVDNSAHIVRSYKDIQYIYQFNQGHGKAKNTGIAASRGEFIAFLDADDVWAPNKLSLQVDHLINNPHVGYALCKMQFLLETGVHMPSGLHKEHLLETPSAYIPSALVVRTSVIKQIGMFDPRYRHSNDSDWFFRAHDAGIVMTILPEILLYKRIHSSNLSHEIQTMSSELLRVIKTSVSRKRGQKWT
jgi:glycosyltransferase involved in cell wall biosynthesis